jgi:hypothetical protein
VLPETYPVGMRDSVRSTMLQPMKNMQRLLAAEEVSLRAKSCEVNKRREPCEIDYDLPIVHRQ